MVRTNLLRLAPPLTLGLLIAPVAVGLAWTALPAFGWLPAIGGNRLSLDGWHALFEAPGFATALRLTLTVGASTSLLALILAMGFSAWRAARPRARELDRFLAPLMASPHSAVALGLAFLIAPSGWLIRLLSPWATGWEQPPAGLVTTQDPWALSFVLGLLLKEVPYLVLMIIAASAQVPVERSMAAARALGQSGPVAWLKAVFPQIYTQIRLPIFAVLAFSLSAVDVGLILAPGNPPPLALLATRWFANYDLKLYFPAAAAASLQFAIALCAVALWYGGEKIVAALGRRWIERGATDRSARAALGGLSAGAGFFGLLGLASIAVMALWSVAGAWRFPDALPQDFRLQAWSAQLDRALETGGTTLAIGLVAVLLALLL
jgi:putative thiamine transport system permease protein